ncbi:Hypothetical predicted protein [Marmota monax]|uniref:Uncharacterized protein n=1 Tax=Marmota monax TaxID=9995 RepID=A0A5E4CS43_MARMO|nr:Hypothetical predicted protein [Marmota monax]
MLNLHHYPAQGTSSSRPVGVDRGIQSPSTGTTGTNGQKDAGRHETSLPAVATSSASCRPPTCHPRHGLELLPCSQLPSGQKAPKILGAATNFAQQPPVPLHTSWLRAERSARAAPSMPQAAQTGVEGGPSSAAILLGTSLHGYLSGIWQGRRPW